MSVELTWTTTLEAAAADVDLFFIASLWDSCPAPGDSHPPLARELAGARCSQSVAEIKGPLLGLLRSRIGSDTLLLSLYPQAEEKYF